jgi:hypothetical protein
LVRDRYVSLVYRIVVTPSSSHKENDHDDENQEEGSATDAHG